MRLVSLVGGVLLLFPPLESATLQRLSLDDMILKSTEIVRGRIADARAALRGPVVYTYVQVQIERSWKGPRTGRAEVALPGGNYGRVRQTFSGVPDLNRGQDYLFFLWTGKSGVTQVIGLSQGVFAVKKDSRGQWVVERPASTEPVLDSTTGQLVQDETVVMPLDQMVDRIQRVLGTGGK